MNERTGGEAPAQAQAGETAPPTGAARPIDIGTLMGGAYGALSRRAEEAPIEFGFSWRGIDFHGRIEAPQGRLRLALASEIASLPFSVEDPEARKSAIAVVEAASRDDNGIRVVHGHKVVLESRMDIADRRIDTIKGLVSLLTVLVLRTAPYLDFLSGRGAAATRP